MALLSVHVTYFSPLSGDTGGGIGNAGLWSEAGAQAAGTDLGPQLGSITQGLAAASDALGRGVLVHSGRICRLWQTCQEGWFGRREGRRLRAGRWERG